MRKLATILLAAALAACSDGPTGSLPPQLVGTWTRLEAATPQTGNLEVRHLLVLEFDGDYEWLMTIHSAGPIPESPMVESLHRVGNWRLLSGRLALRTVSGISWRYDQGSSQLDYIGDWTARHRVELQGGRLLLHYEPSEGESVAPYTLEFTRAPDLH